MDGYIDPFGAYLLAGVLLVAAVAAVLPTIFGLRAAAAGGARDLEITFWVGVAMVFSYSCWPFRYRVCVCVCMSVCVLSIHGSVSNHNYILILLIYWYYKVQNRGQYSSIWIAWSEKLKTYHGDLIGRSCASNTLTCTEIEPRRVFCVIFPAFPTFVALCDHGEGTQAAHGTNFPVV